MSTEGNGSLVSSTDVNGTAVYSREGTHIGTIDHLMIDKQSGKVAYAVMGFGGFFGLGEEHHPVPWGKLSYDVSRDGFSTDLTEAEVQGAPERHDDWHRDRAWEQRVHEHYGAPMYWI
ncbi:PRC-barrel domain-containing protein [Marinovum sp.]|uniref:PRC-barrel domain-containing protein n=1 Tax=Marinovum sp. TaxID=2024839 RepID=UPI002B276900|nr:PRC-barrel domain-containing protein [Marinovum sp.]